MISRIKNDYFRDFIKNVVSRCPMMFYKNDGIVSLCRTSDRIWSIITLGKFNEERDGFLKFGQDFDYSISFFENLQRLMRNVSWPSRISYMNNENCDYADMICGIKNVYLSSNVTFGSENVCYSFSIKNNSRNIFNSVSVWNYCDNIYMSAWVTNSYNIFYSDYINNCSDTWFSSNMVWCRECLFCNDLDNMSYCIYNKQYSPNEFAVEKQKILSQKKNFMEYYQKLNKVWKNINSSNCKWWVIIQSENIQEWYFVNQIKNGKNLIMVWWKDACEEMYNCFQCASKKENYNYGAMASWWWDHLVTNYSVEWSYMYYNCLMEWCSYCLGCVWLKNKQFCILNKEYTKEDRFELANQIFEKMDAEWTLWAFFPASMNPFYFNDTAAYLIDDSFTKEEVTKEWYLWRDEEIKVDGPEWAEIVLSRHPEWSEGSERTSLDSSMPQNDKARIKTLNDFQWFDSNWDWKIDREILKKVIKDEKGNYYRIVPMELDFLQKYGLPLPEIHRLDRIKLWFKFK